MAARRGNWTYVHTRYDGPRWQLDGTTLQLEHDPSSHACCNGGGRCNGAWSLYSPSRYLALVDSYLAGSMDFVEEHVADYFTVECLRCHRVLVDRDEVGWYYQVAVEMPEAPGLTFMDRVHECEGQPHELGAGVAKTAQRMRDTALVRASAEEAMRLGPLEAS